MGLSESVSGVPAGKDFYLIAKTIRVLAPIEN
jgi:hypothetical protein